MSSTLQRSPSGNMDIQRMFGTVKAESYSPEEYARSLGPLIEQRLRTGPIASSNSSLEPAHKGVQLTIVCERTFLVRTQPGADANTVLHESGKPAQSDFNKFIGGLFEAANSLTAVNLVDALGNTHTFAREDIPATASGLNEDAGDGSLDLSAFDGGGGTPSNFSQAPASGAVNERLSYDVDRMGNVTITDTQTREDVYVQGEDGSKLADELDNAPNTRVQQMILDQYSVLFGESQRPVAEDVAKFLGERADWIGAATRLLADSELDKKQHTQEGLGYRAYLRQVVTKKDPGYLTKSEDRDIRNGALKARKDVINLAGTLNVESLEPLAEASTILPAYGRDYKSKAAAIADFNAGKDFIIADFSSRWDGKPVNKEDLMGTGQRSVNIRFNNKRNVAVVPIA